jgi:hypothetical protein
LKAHNLELNGNDSEVEDLYCRPKYEVGLQRRQVNIPELLGQGSLASSFRNGHKGKEARETYNKHCQFEIQRGRPTDKLIPKGAKIN